MPVTTVFVNSAVMVPLQSSVYPVIAFVALKGAAAAALALHALVPDVPAYGAPVREGAVSVSYTHLTLPTSDLV